LQYFFFEELGDEPPQGDFEPFFARWENIEFFQRRKKRLKIAFEPGAWLKRARKKVFFEKIGGGHVRKRTLLHFCPKAFLKIYRFKLKHCT